jgi:hypothetical protein
MEIFFTLKNLVTACIFKAAYMFWNVVIFN